MPLEYKPHFLSRLLSVEALLSADYMLGSHPDTQHHMHDNAYELCYCELGDMLLLKKDEYIPLHAGQCDLVSPGTLHDSLIESAETRALLISFICSGDSLRLLENLTITLTEEQKKLLLHIITGLKESYEENERGLRLYDFTLRKDMPLGAEQMVCCYLELFLISLLRSTTMCDGSLITNNQFESTKEHYLVQNIQSYIQTHLSSELTVQELVDVFHYSRSSLTAFFKRYAGMSVGKYIAAQRLTLAKKLLLEGNDSIAKIAELSGYPSPQYFSRKFHKEVGCSPSDFYKKHIRSATASTSPSSEEQ